MLILSIIEIMSIIYYNNFTQKYIYLFNNCIVQRDEIRINPIQGVWDINCIIMKYYQSYDINLKTYDYFLSVI